MTNMTPDELWEMIEFYKTKACGTCRGFTKSGCGECDRYTKFVYKHAENADVADGLLESILDHFVSVNNKQEGLFTWEDYNNE